ncbi:MAG: thiamine phosphate synthase, partial [Oscillospiraceae bacterium]|nr:thiamine phosphate synthase [Oscillospiraceae bacterium]
AAQKAEQAGADYIGVGAVFATSTKKNAKNITPEKLAEICDSVTIPAVAIGGITEENILTLKNSKIAGAAVVSAIYKNDDVFSATKRLKALCEEIVKG